MSAPPSIPPVQDCPHCDGGVIVSLPPCPVCQGNGQVMAFGELLVIPVKRDPQSNEAA